MHGPARQLLIDEADLGGEVGVDARRKGEATRLRLSCLNRAPHIGPHRSRPSASRCCDWTAMELSRLARPSRNRSSFPPNPVGALAEKGRRKPLARKCLAFFNWLRVAPL